MNPLELRGPDFLLFYWATAVAAWLLLWGLLVVYEAGTMPHLRGMDPYLIAYLRGGAKESVRLAMFSLVDRGLLTADVPSGAKGPATLKAEVDRAETRDPVEGVILKRCRGGADAGEVLQDQAVLRACDKYADALRRLGLYPNGEQKAWRRIVLAVGGGLLLLLAVAKVMIGLSRGRPVAFLVISAIIVVLVTAGITVGRARTALGTRFLRDLRTLFVGLKQRASSLRPGGATDEAMLLAAVFGVTTLPTLHFPYAQHLGPRGDVSSPSSCGSSCGGGDGGGGGCGGCGGGGGD